MVLLNFNTYEEPVIGYGLLIHHCISKNRLKPFFTLQKMILGQNFFKARFYPSADLFTEKNVLTVYDCSFFELLSCFLVLVRSFLPIEYLNSFYEKKYLTFKPRKAQLNVFSLPKESCSVTRNSLRYRGAQLVNCLRNRFGYSYFSIRIKRLTLKHHQRVKVKDQNPNIIFQ